MNLRPAGMSDDEEEEEIYFGVNDPKTHDDTNKDHTDEASLPKKIINYHNYHNEEQALESQVINACIHGQMDTIYEYLKREFTPLLALCASRCGLPETCLKCLVLLIEAKADVNAVGKHRETALMHACKTKNTEFVMELLKHIDDINFCDNYRQTALNHAVTSNRPDIVSVLLMHDADPDMPDKDGYTPEMIAVREGFKELHKENDIGIPACFLSSPKKRKNRTKWVISLSVTLIIGLYICKTCIHK
ncbi:DNA-binding protein RFXANK [Harpegnathos saltator]|uniref:DNA-binding protein RFXANK n=1 Tax=Harpegnathos saltator TaxID=610380 RepID=E2BTS8_HARSA|nr:DNA-binding protein RFXANK [Harpegnathos saltator]